MANKWVLNAANDVLFPPMYYNETPSPSQLWTPYPTYPNQPSNYNQKAPITGMPTFALYVLAICLLICCAGCFIKSTPNTESIESTATAQENATSRENSARPSTSEDLVLEAVKKMSLSDRKLFLANALKIEKCKSSGESSSFRKVFRISAYESCSICLEQFQDGEDICASPNIACSHVFHRDCILDWLLTHEICPICRRNYLQLDSIRSTQDLRDDIERGVVIDPSIVHPATTGIDNMVAEDPHFMIPYTGLAGIPTIDEPLRETLGPSMSAADLHESISGSTITISSYVADDAKRITF